MMTIDDIKALIASDESRTLELKKTTGELKDGMHAACAFLNTEGGWLIFGITPKSLKIIGQQVTDDTQREVGLSDRSTIDQARGRTAQPPTKYRPITPQARPKYYRKYYRRFKKYYRKYYRSSYEFYRIY